MKFSQSVIFKLAIVVCLSLPLYTLAADETTPCPSGIECDSVNTFLECVGTGATAKCQCNTAAQWQTDKCVLKLGSTCQNPIVQPCLLFTECTQDANIPTEYKCQCKGGTTAVGTECKANYDAPCDATAGSTTYPNCAPATFSDCLPAGDGQPSKCQCSTNEVWEAPACALNVDQSCDGDQPCRKLSTCPAAGADRKCACDANVPDLIYNGFGACVIKNGAACDNNRPCDEVTAICDPGTNKCTCNAGVVENGFGLCRAVAGKHCNASMPCDLAAECNPTSNICQCDIGTEPNTAQRCRVIYGGNCDKVDKLCDELKQLVCLEGGKCGCSGEFEYDEENKQCSGASIILTINITSSTNIVIQQQKL